MGINPGKTVGEYASEDAVDVLNELESSYKGLSATEAHKRLKELGANIIAKKKELNLLVDFLKHFTEPLILILLFAAIISLFMKEDTDAVIIFLMVLFGVILDFYQEYTADKALKKLADSVKTTTLVIRGGVSQEIKTSDIVIGDIIILSSGNMIPADSRVLEAKNFFVNQSAITGESYPSEKSPVVANSESIPALNNILYLGTNVVSGTAKAVVIKTGEDTEFGHISARLAQTPEKSEFEHGVTNFGFFIMKLTFILVIFIFLFNSLMKHNFFQSFMFAIAIAVGVTPELLPMIMSVTMTAGSKKMAKKGVIVKKLSSIPNLGAMTILCTDKTGTLTENRIKLVKYTDYSGKDDEQVLHLAYLNSHFQTGIKNPMDEAVLNFENIDVNSYAKIDEIPYDFLRKRMGVIVRKRTDTLMITKGAPEEIFKLCKYCHSGQKRMPLGSSIRKRAVEVYNELSNEGYRVLAVARRQLVKKSSYSKDDEIDMEFVGFVSFLDPPKKDVKGVIEELQKLGVEIKVITGDNELVTKKICNEVGLQVKGILLGSVIANLNDNELRMKAENSTIFARFSPADKDRVISVLRAGKHVVGYMGDGINDAPSLKTADVGISVSNAVDIAKESADIILTEESLRVLEEGIIEGRKTFGNTMKYVMMGISSNFGNMFSAAGAVVFLPFLPMLPIQILLNNFIYDFSQITIPTDNVDKEWTLKPKRWNLKFIKKFMYVFGPVSSLFDFITFFILFFVIKVSAPVFQTGWFMESLATQVLVIYVIRTKESLFKSKASMALVISSIVCLAVGWILPYTKLGAIFRFEPVPVHILLILGAIVVAYLITVDVTKKLFYRKVDF